MLLGKIDYLNLLPFHVFLKSLPLPSYVKKSIEFKKGVPSKLCADLYYRRIDAAVISSIESRRAKYCKLPLGIVAKREVLSVLVRKNSAPRLDPASMSSNMLARVLDLRGEVLIGDNALKALLSQGRDKFYDLGEIWQQRTGLPFVFGRLCCVKNEKAYARLATKFLRSRIKIPRYILQSYALSRGIKEREILNYLKFISYKIGVREELALKKFIAKAKKLKFNPVQKEKL